MSPDPATPALPDDAAALPSGARMPLLGFGTWKLEGAAAQQAVETALAVGYRHLDTATIYGNEREVGAALRASGVPASDVFVTTKLPPDRSGEARRVLEQSLDALGLDRVDLWLVHWAEDGADVELWRAFLAARREGLVRDVGVSNHSLDMVDRLREETGEQPAVNQVKWSPLRFDRRFLEGHRERGVVLEGYSTLKDGNLEQPAVVEIAERLGRTPAQVLVRWHLEHGVVVIPKSAQAERIRSNADVDGFALGPDDVAAIDALTTR